ncbi:MAG TPA: pilus assembly protein TadG-related protein [Pyrinomonadaceae bacterium]|nr:pilus assembly protein TadG-related protein [Pyrinomonadaceae bacterium]
MKIKCVPSSSRRKSERGSVLAYTVLSVLFIFFAVGLGADLSHLYMVKTDLQNSADAAALAGASALSLPNDVKIPTAVDRAIEVLNANRYNFDKRHYDDLMTVEDQRALVRFAVNLSEFDSGGTGISEEDAAAAPDNIRFVRVITPAAPVSIFFSIPLLGASRDLTAKAVSGLSIPGNVSVCIAPLSAIYDPNADMPPENWGNCPIEGGRGPNDPQPVPPSGPDPDGNGFCNPKREFCKRCTYTIRAEPAGGPSGGNYQILACAGNGASQVRQALARYNNCQCGLASVGDEIEVPTQPGVDAGAVRQGLNVRFDVYGAGGLNYSTDIPPDTNIAQGTSSGNGNSQTWTGITWGQYQANTPTAPPNNSHPGVANRRVLIIPTIELSEFQNGRDDVHIGGLGGFFMKSQVGNGNNGDIKVEFIGDDITSVIGFDPNDDNVTNIVTPVLYR